MNFIERFSELKKDFDQDRPTTYRDKTLNEQFNDYLKQLERETATRILNDVLNHSINNPLENTIIINIDDWYGIVAKYTGREIK